MSSDVVDIKAIIDGNFCNFSCLLNLSELASFFLSLGLLLGSSFLLIYLLLGGSCLRLLHCFDLGAFLRLDKQSLISLSFSLDDFLLLFLVVLGSFFFTIVLLLIVVGRLEPGDELSQAGSHGLLSFTIVKDTVFIQLLCLVVPGDEELVFEEAIVVNLLTEGWSELEVLWVAVDEELNDGLQHVFRSLFTILGHQLSEHSFIGVPLLYDVAMETEDRAKADVELVFTGDIKLELLLASFS